MANPHFTTLRVERDVAERVNAYKKSQGFENNSEAVQELLELNGVGGS